MTVSTRTWPAQPAGRISLLDVDPDLARHSEAAALDGHARLTAPVFRIGQGAMPEPPGADAHLGYLLLKGLLLYEVSVCGRATAELLGPGDLVRAREHDDGSMLSSETKWTALEQTLLADLGPVEAEGGTVTREVLESLLARSAARAEAVALERSIAAHVRVDVRILCYLWHLADRFGVVIPGAVKLNVPLTHAVLARLVGARRPTVTTALQRLSQLGYVRRENRAFVLVGDASTVEELEKRSPARDFALPDGTSDGYAPPPVNGR